MTRLQSVPRLWLVRARPHLRLGLLFARSRLVGPAAGIIVAAAALTLGTYLWSGATGGIVMTVFGPVIPAVAIACAARSPFGDVERSAGDHLPALRFVSLGGLVLWAALVLAIAAGGVPPAANAVGVLTRNLVGYTGLALLGARLVGIDACWLLPVVCGAGALVIQLTISPVTAWWFWPAHALASQPALAIATLLFAAGLVALVLSGPREAVATPG